MDENSLQNILPAPCAEEDKDTFLNSEEGEEENNELNNLDSSASNVNFFFFRYTVKVYICYLLLYMDILYNIIYYPFYILIHLVNFL